MIDLIRRRYPRTMLYLVVAATITLLLQLLEVVWR